MIRFYAAPTVESVVPMFTCDYCSTPVEDAPTALIGLPGVRDAAHLGTGPVAGILVHKRDCKDRWQTIHGPVELWFEVESVLPKACFNSRLTCPERTPENPED